MQMKQVYSSHIDAVGYDEKLQELHVTYKTGKTAVYAGVPPETADHVLKAGSVGTALHEVVKGRFGHSYR